VQPVRFALEFRFPLAAKHSESLEHRIAPLPLAERQRAVRRKEELPAVSRGLKVGVCR
jgi:hypothetical protein